MSNVKTGDLAIIVGAYIPHPANTPRPVVEVGEQASGYVEVVCESGYIFRCTVSPTSINWWCKFPVPYPACERTREGLIEYATLQPMNDSLLRKISGPDVFAQDHTEIFHDGPISAEERVTLKERKQRAARKLIEEGRQHHD